MWPLEDRIVYETPTQTDSRRQKYVCYAKKTPRPKPKVQWIKVQWRNPQEMGSKTRQTVGSVHGERWMEFGRGESEERSEGRRDGGS